MISNLLTVEERGRLDGLREAARNMKAEGMSAETIARFTKLSVSEVEKL